MRGRRTFWIAISIGFGFATVLFLLPFLFYVTRVASAYELSRVIAASLTVAVAGGAAVVGLMRYWQDSHLKRVERSMAFWERSNSKDFRNELKEFITYWMGKEPSDFKRLAESDSEKDTDHDSKLAIEFVLDFYNEACGAVLAGACDEWTMYAYLGSLMLEHSKVLGIFVDAWRKKQGRPEKWDFFTSLTTKWAFKKRKLDRKYNRLLP